MQGQSETLNQKGGCTFPIFPKQVKISEGACTNGGHICTVLVSQHQLEVPVLTASASLQRVHTGGPGFQHFLKCQGTCKVLECSLLWNKQTMSNKTTSGEHYSIFPYNHHISQSFAWPHPIMRAIQNMRANLSLVQEELENLLNGKDKFIASLSAC